MSPTVLRRDGFRFFFFSREEKRMHIHVQHDKGEAKFWLEPESRWLEITNYRLSNCSMRRRSLARTMRQSVKAGAITFPEVTNISKHGIWLLTERAEHFLPFEQFPWFAKATVEQIVNVVEPSPGHYHWPDLDVDLSESILDAPENYPLISKV